MPLEVGSRQGPYEIVAELGSGGMGHVYRAQDTKLGRQVAIKILRPEVSQDHDTLSRFQREARALAQLNIPSVATIYDLIEADGRLCLIMELVPGQTLAERLRSAGPLPLRDALLVGLHMAEALEASHEKGIVHRDLKPANIKITPDGKTKLLDFGLAKSLAGPGEPSGPHWATFAPTAPGMVMGTPPYMSPEQTRGQDVDKRTDIWAFGCVLYEALTGRRAFAGQTVSDVLASIIERDPDWNALPATTPEPLRKLLQRCLVKDPGRRLRDIGEARILLEELTRDFSWTQEIMPADQVKNPAGRSVQGGTAEAAIQANVRDPGPSGAATDPAYGPRPAPQRTVNVAMPGASTASSPSRLGMLLLFGSVFVITAGAAYFFLFIYGKRAHSVAVLSFAAPEGDAELADLAKRMTEELTTRLTQTRELKVASPSQVAPFTSNSNPKDAGRRLGVQAVLTGRFIKQGEEVSLRLEMVEVETGDLLFRDQSQAWVAGETRHVDVDGWARQTAHNVRQVIDK
jgi:serine/threonine protein kinase/TolB-like protein